MQKVTVLLEYFVISVCCIRDHKQNSQKSFPGTKVFGFCTEGKLPPQRVTLVEEITIDAGIKLIKLITVPTAGVPWL